ncbi:MAG: glutamate--tRNA ligase [Chitinophagaceae bacterium]
MSTSTTVRTRFAPSPTGGLHLGGVRTALFSYLFAKQHGGQFVLRIEDTDQNRFVPGAEQYIQDALAWCGIHPDESPFHGGPHTPYRQSERKDLYKQYALQLVQAGHAYYAFDTPEELEAMRAAAKSENEHATFQYDHHTRGNLRNSLNLSSAEVDALLQAGTPYVIRIAMPAQETIAFTDMIRGPIEFEPGLCDDKVLLKADGMPTYHLAVVVDDYLMNITHAFRGEEWLPSAPVHIKLWDYLGWKDSMPSWAHLPLILKPDGHGKLSKRDGQRLGFPVFPLTWTDPATNEQHQGFREMGFLPEAFVNLLALLGWNSGAEQEVFSMDELIAQFRMERVHKGGAKFDFEKAKWFNHEWIKHSATERLMPDVLPILQQAGIAADAEKLSVIIPLVKERCLLLNDFVQQCEYFFRMPARFDYDVIAPKWTADKATFFNTWLAEWAETKTTDFAAIEAHAKQLATTMNIKLGELQLPLRIMLVGDKFGPNVFQIAALLGYEATAERVMMGLKALG